MDKNNKKKIIISIIILTVVFAGVFLGIEKFSNSHEEIKIEDKSLPDNSGTYTSITTPETIDEIPKSYFGFVRADAVQVSFNNCTVWDRVTPPEEQIIFGPAVLEQERNNPLRKFCYNITPETVITKTYTHGAKYKGQKINVRVTYFDFQPMDASDIAVYPGAVPSFGVYNENIVDNMSQYSQMIYSFKEKFEFFDDNNNPVKITNGYLSIGGHNRFEWTGHIENISNVYVGENTIMSNTFTYDETRLPSALTNETFNKGISRYNTWLTAGYEDWNAGGVTWESRGDEGFIFYKIKDNSSDFTLVIGKDFEAYLTMETVPNTTTPLDFHTLTINYLEQGTNTVLKAKYGPEGVETGKSYNVSSPETINKDNKTYQIVDINQKNVTGEMPNEDVVINVYYEEIIQKSSYTVNYLDKETNNPIHDPKTVNDVQYNTVIQSSSEIISINNYRYDSADKNQITISEGSNVINLYYNRLKGKVIEKHIDENTNAILYEEEHTLPVGNEYNIPSKTFNNYVLNEDRLPTNATGTVREESQEVIYYYRRIVNVEIEKQDETRTKLSGAKLSIYNSSNNLITSWTTTNASHNITLNPGTYTLKEEITPTGYETSSDITFTINNEGKLLINNMEKEKIIMIDNYKKYPYTINYLDKETNNPIHNPKTVNNIKYNTVIQSSNEVISINNYRYDSADKNQITISEGSNVINLYYNKIKGGVIEKHIDENTNAILYEEEHTLSVGDEYNIPSKTFNNYVLNEDRLPTNAIGTVREESQEVIYYYRRIVNVEIEKQDETRTKLSGAKLSVYNSSNNLITSWTTTNASHNITLNPGTYTLKEEITPNGYETSSDIVFIINNEGKLLVNNTEKEKIIMIDNYKKSSYTVNYLDKETQEVIHTSKTVNNIKINTKIKASDEAISITNYIYDSADKEELIIGESNNFINLYYTKTKGGIVEKHIDENTNAILYEEEHTLPVGDEYNIPSKTFNNYVLNEDRLPTNATGTVREESQEVIYYYRRIVNVEIIKQDETGTKLLGAKLSLYDNTNTLITSWTTTNVSHNITLSPGTYTLKEEITPNGYETSSDITFTINNEGKLLVNNTETEKIIMIDNYKKYPYTINYLDKETKKPIQDPKTTENIKYGTTIKASDEVINITNYIYNSSDKEEITIGLDNNVINLYYERIKGGVVEKHVDETRNVILYEEEHSLLVGDEYNIPSKTFENYVLMEDKLPTNATGTVKEEGQEVIYYYRKLVNVITKVTNEGGTIEGDEEVLEEKDSTPNKIVIKADDNHYIEKVTINGEEIEIKDNREMILENFKIMKEDKLVEVSFGDIIKEVPKTDKNTILPIISIMVLAVGMLIVIIQSKKFKKN